ncbi:hypothetical protein [Synechococcus sp. 1G10]|uniref:hypothetical protein n=1 Tax=Synechococcus sp. 1G10 TaxID=2025605 RepID=UPI001181553D|nr:hypothetical protein [Synechococcus sp. 1G10]
MVITAVVEKNALPTHRPAAGSRAALPLCGEPLAIALDAASDRQPASAVSDCWLPDAGSIAFHRHP